MFEKHAVTIPFGENRELILETGQVARQAHGSVIARVGGTVVMANAVRSNKPLENADFFPLQVDYREKHYAVGRIPGNYFRREGRPGTPETINARLVDRAIRPMFPKGFNYEVQVYLTVLSMDQENPPSVPSLIAASAALAISDIPFNGPVGAVRLAYLGEKLCANPTFAERGVALLDLVMGGTPTAVTMVEAGANCLNEEKLLAALAEGPAHIQAVTSGINQLVALCGKPKMHFESPKPNEAVVAAAAEFASHRFGPINAVLEKHDREAAVDELRIETVAAMHERFGAGLDDAALKKLDREVAEAFDATYKKNVRAMVLREKRRADGRQLTQVRPIAIDTQFLPMAHGSVLFTRGQTQSLGVTTLGTVGDQPKIDDLMGLSTERFMLHYNFPSYSVGETRRIMGPGRRELGHGMLAQRAIEPILPDADKFPYTIRIVSEITESNGSSSMASICAGCLSLMDAGVPVKAPVAGIAMGLIKEGDEVAILTDIMGMEDHLGDMDFKVGGTRDGITALQMDIKLAEGLSLEIMTRALAQAREARLFILDRMAEALPTHRPDLSPRAPRIEIVKIDPARIGELIGPSGKNIRGICEATGAKIDIEDDGSVFIAAADGEIMRRAREMVVACTASPEIGKTYTGKVVRITDFGCFVEILPKKDGLVHVSELDFTRVEKVTDICREGDIMKVKCIDIDPMGKVRLSRKAALADEPGFVPPPGYKPDEPGSHRPHGGGGGDRGGRPHGGGPRHDRGGRGGVDRGGVDRGGRHHDD